MVSSIEHSSILLVLSALLVNLRPSIFLFIWRKLHWVVFVFHAMEMSCIPVENAILRLSVRKMLPMEVMQVPLIDLRVLVNLNILLNVLEILPNSVPDSLAWLGLHRIIIKLVHIPVPLALSVPAFHSEELPLVFIEIWMLLYLVREGNWLDCFILVSARLV